MKTANGVQTPERYKIQETTTDELLDVFTDTGQNGSATIFTPNAF